MPLLLSSTPLSRASQTQTGRHTARRSTGGTPGNGKRHHQLRSRHLGDKPGTLQEHLEACKKQSACTHQTGRVCNATGHIHRLWEHGQARHDQSETREGTTGRLTHPQGPREPLRKVRAGQRSGRRAAPLPSTHHRQTDGVERRGARWQNEKSGRHSP